jgi:DNA-binding LacI/PurR family transcriptional regulator
MKLYEVAREVGCSVETVRAVLRKNDVKILSSAHIRTPEEIAEAGRKISAANLGRRAY